MATMKFSTFGQRVKHARISLGLSQSELAKAIGRISKTKITKSLISQWEVGKVNNPQNPALTALRDATGYSIDWLVHGKGPERDPLPRMKVAEAQATYAPGMDRASLRRSIQIALGEHTEPDLVVAAAIEVFETLCDEPEANIPDSVLKRIAKTAKPKI